MKILLPGLTALLITLTGCSVFQTPALDPITQISRLEPGMSKETVRRMLGEPAKAEFNSRADAWHYCRSGKTAHEFAVVTFYDGKVTTARLLTANVEDSKTAEHCELAIKPVLFPPAR
ncbi:MAG TPA: outer membrane protein assembly factor BamE [Fluviicoccus sp.]|nr:outer membrane protein assembly factor BamE [Fluviicoccus sp.]